MGEYAEMMLDGTCCCQCGEFLGGDGDGFPVMCAACEADDAKLSANTAERKRTDAVLARMDAQGARPTEERDDG